MLKKNKKQKVVISSSFGGFEPDMHFKIFLKALDVELFSIEGRTHPEIIAYIETYSDEYGVLRGKDRYQYVRLVEVDTSRPWFIDVYDGSESIRYLDYKYVNKKLKYVELI